MSEKQTSEEKEGKGEAEVEQKDERWKDPRG